jgi:hypothetical protein
MNALSTQEVAALRERDIVYVRTEVRKPFGEFGTVCCRIANAGRAPHYAPVVPEHIVARAAPGLGREGPCGYFIPETSPTPPPAPRKK